MINEINDIDDLIGKVLSGEATPGELRELEEWCALSAANQEYFDDIKVIFHRAAANKVKVTFDTDAAWQVVKSRLAYGEARLTSGEAKVVKLPQRQFEYWPMLRVAAGVVVALALGVMGYRWYNQPTQTHELTAFENNTVQDTLPDGSTAFLNKKSSIVYEYNPREKTRKVKLKGEGYFEVKHEEEKPFVIETDETLIRDIGTAFNIKSYPESDTVEVVVQSGNVQFYTLQNPGLTLNAGETGIYSKKTKAFSKIEKADTNVLAYKTGVFSFHSTDLRSAVERINEVYNSKIVLANEKIANCRLTATFNNDKLDHVVDVIAESLSLTIEHQDDGRIVLTGPGCQ